MFAHFFHKAMTLVFDCLVEHLPCLTCIAEIAVAPEVNLVEHSLDSTLDLVVH